MRRCLVALSAWLLATQACVAAQAAAQQDAAPASDKHSQPLEARTVSTGIVLASGGGIYFGGRQISPPFALEYLRDTLVVNGYKLRPTATPVRRRAVASRQDSLRYQLSSLVSEEVQRAYAQGLPDREVIERLVPIYSASTLVQSVDHDSTRLAVTYRSNPALPERVILPTREPPASVAEREARRLERRRQELLDLKHSLEGGALLVILPDVRLSFPRQEAARARDAIERYQQRGDSSGLSGLVPADIWKYLRHPVGYEPAR